MDEPSLLRSLAARAPTHELAGRATWLLQAAEAAGHARQRMAHALDRIMTDTRLCLSPDAEEPSGVALWTGRLVCTDLGWTLTSGPARQPRPPESLGRGLAQGSYRVTPVSAIPVLEVMARVRPAGSARAGDNRRSCRRRPAASSR